MVIELTKNKLALIDLEDFDKVSKYSWSFDGRYAQSNSNRKKIYLHRIIMGAKKGQMIDHINGDKLDNRKSNLRFTNKSLNGANMKPRKEFKGISYVRSGKKIKRWKAFIFVKRSRKSLGIYLTKQEAALAYNMAAKKYFGEHARLNGVELG